MESWQRGSFVILRLSGIAASKKAPYRLYRKGKGQDHLLGTFTSLIAAKRAAR